MTHDKNASSTVATPDKSHQGTTDHSPITEMDIDLGYADPSSSAFEQSTDGTNTEDSHIEHAVIDATIQTLSMDERVADDAPTTSNANADNKIEDSASAENTSEAITTGVGEHIDNDVNEEEIVTLDEIVDVDDEDIAPLLTDTTFTPVNEAPSTPKDTPQKSGNPFLPQHILDKLSQGRKDLADDIVQSSAALDVSTALLRTHARAERLSTGSFNATSFNTTSANHNNPFATKDSISKQKQKLVDDLVDEYLPLVAAELRRRLHKLVDQ